MSAPELRLACTADLAGINEIHSHYVSNTTSTYALQPLTMEERTRWFATRAEIHPVTVVHSEGKVLAWGSMGPFRLLAGYRSTVENSIYVHPKHVRQGLGSMILADQLERARTLDIHSIVAVIDSNQVASLELHRKYGFVQAGRFPQIARKFDRWQDAVFMQLLLEAGDGRKDK